MYLYLYLSIILKVFFYKTENNIDEFASWKNVENVVSLFERYRSTYSHRPKSETISFQSNNYESERRE